MQHGLWLSTGCPWQCKGHELSWQQWLLMSAFVLCGQHVCQCCVMSTTTILQLQSYTALRHEHNHNTTVAVIHSSTSWTQRENCLMTLWTVLSGRRRHRPGSCPCTGGIWAMLNNDLPKFNCVHHITSSIGPRTEPYGMPYWTICKLDATCWLLPMTNDAIQLRSEPLSPKSSWLASIRQDATWLFLWNRDSNMPTGSEVFHCRTGSGEVV